MSWDHLQDIERRRIVMPAGVRMRLNRLERPEPLPASVRETISRALAMHDYSVHQYPAYQPFYEKIANTFQGAFVDRLVVGAGIEEFIRALFMLTEGKVAYLWPTCAMFDLYGLIFNRPVQRLVTVADQVSNVYDLVDALDPDVKLLLLVNPGQPVDTCFDVDALRVLAGALADRGAVLAIDEAYYGFGAPSGIMLTQEFDNVTVLRTFSKCWGLAGARIGFAVSSERVHRQLNAVRQSGEVSAASMIMAGAVMDCAAEIAESIAETVRGRNWLHHKVGRLPNFTVRGSWANHVLIGFPDPARARHVRGALAKRGVLAKSDYPAPLDRYMLVTCGGQALMEEFYEEFQACL